VEGINPGGPFYACSLVVVVVAVAVVILGAIILVAMIVEVV
jgi:hypothetical protein